MKLSHVNEDNNVTLIMSTVNTDIYLNTVIIFEIGSI